MPRIFCLAQVDSLSLKNIWLDNDYRSKYPGHVFWLNDSLELKLAHSKESTTLHTCNISDGDTIKSARFPFHFYSFDIGPDQKSLIVHRKVESIYRYSRKTISCLTSLDDKDTIRIGDSWIRDAQFSPDGKYISYIQGNNLYVFNTATLKSTQLTPEGQLGTVINGHTDWVNEEEFGYTRAYAWSPKSDAIAYLRFDESKVSEYSMQLWGDSLYPDYYTFKYPKAGEKAAEVSLCVTDLAGKQLLSKSLTELGLSDESYLVEPKFLPNGKAVSLECFNRLQNDFRLIHVNLTGKVEVVYREEDKRYVDRPLMLTYMEKEPCVFLTSEKSGSNHIYMLNYNSGKMKQLTKGEWEISRVFGVDEKSEKIYFNSTADGSINRSAYVIDFNGKNLELIHDLVYGVSYLIPSPNHEYFVLSYSNIASPPVYTLLDKNFNKVRLIESNDELTAQCKTLQNVEWKEIKTAEGQSLNAYFIMPPDFDVTKTYPALLYVYGGPGYQTVLNRWQGNMLLWHQLIARKGYIIVSIDGRGTGGKGAEFKKCTYGSLGQLETIDVIGAANFLKTQLFVDPDRIGIWGWSYGGYLSTMALLRGNKVFSTAVAVAPVIDWRLYDCIYTERYLSTPQLNPQGYKNSSPISYVDSLKGNYLLIHGSGDDNVHLQHTMMMQNAFVKAGKHFDMHIYTDKNHSIYGGNTRYYLFQQITNYLLKHL